MVYHQGGPRARRRPCYALVAAVTLLTLLGGTLGSLPVRGPTTNPVQGASTASSAGAREQSGPASASVANTSDIQTQVELDLLNGSSFVSPSALETGFSGATNRSFPALLTGADTSQFWTAGSSVLLMAPEASTPGWSSGLFLYPAHSAKQISVSSVGTAWPSAIADGMEAYFFLAPVSNASWGFPYFAIGGANGSDACVQGSVIFPYAEHPYLVVQWDPYWYDSYCGYPPPFTVYSVTPEVSGIVTSADIQVLAGVGVYTGGFPNPGDNLSFTTTYREVSNTLYATLVDENASPSKAYYATLLTNLSGLWTPSANTTSGAWYFGTGASSSTEFTSGWALLYAGFSSSRPSAISFNSGGPSGSDIFYLVVVGAIAAVAVIIAIVQTLRSRGGRPPTPPQAAQGASASPPVSRP